MVVITISYPHQPRFNYSVASSTSVSPTLTDTSSEPLPSLLQVSSDGDTIAATKQEEWVTKKRVELTTTKQIETRVKRQVVLEDGKVVDDSGPIVTTTTTEDTDKNESEHTEHLTHGDDPDTKEGWVAVEGLPEDAVVKETNERKVTTHDEVEDIIETEQVQHLGDISNHTLVRAIRDGSDARKALRSPTDKNELSLFSNNKDALPKKILQQSRKHDRTTDIEDTKEVSKVKENGNVVTEITRRHEHEEFHNEDIPDSGSEDYEQIENREGSHDYSHAKNEDFIEYIQVPKGGKPSQGVKVGDGAHIVSENISSQRQGDEDLWDSVSERIRRLPKSETIFNNTTNNKLNTLASSRSDALTNRPLDFDQEEYTRKNETNRWLNSHFGSSSSSLNSEASPRSPLHSTPTGIHVTMTSRSSPLNSPPPPPPLPSGQNHSSRVNNASTKLFSKPEKEHVGKRISFGDVSSHPSPPHKDVHFDLKNRHEDVMRSLNSQFGRASNTKSGSLWDEEPTPTPPPRSRRRNSPDIRTVHNNVAADQSHNVSQTGTMNHHQHRRFTAEIPSYLQKSNDVGERKAYERREQSFGYNGPNGQRNLTRDSLESGNFGDSGYVTKHSNYYKTNETNNPAQNSLYENGSAEVTERRTVERREKTFSYDGAPQKQFHPKYILGTNSSTMNRLKGIEQSGGVGEDTPDSRSQTMPRRRFYFGDNEGSLVGKEREKRNSPVKELRFGTDDINVSISNSYNNNHSGPEVRKGSLNRSMSFTPRSLSRERPSFSSSNLTQHHKLNHTYKSNPQLLDSPDLLSPKLITNMSRSVRDVHKVSSQNDRFNISNRQDSSNNISRSKKTFLESVKKNSQDYHEPVLRGSKASSPARSMTPTNAYAPLRNSISDSRNQIARQSLNSPRAFGGANSPLSDDYQETYRMSASTPDQDESKPRITTDTTSRFSRRTIRGMDGQPAGKVESSETTTRTKSRYKESEVMYPNGRRIGSPGYTNDFQPQLTSAGSVIIPVRDTNNNKNVHYAK